jgi:TonB family protein
MELLGPENTTARICCLVLRAAASGDSTANDARHAEHLVATSAHLVLTHSALLVALPSLVVSRETLFFTFTLLDRTNAMLVVSHASLVCAHAMFLVADATLHRTLLSLVDLSQFPLPALVLTPSELLVAAPQFVDTPFRLPVHPSLYLYPPLLGAPLGTFDLINGLCVACRCRQQHQTKERGRHQCRGEHRWSRRLDARLDTAMGKCVGPPAWLNVRVAASMGGWKARARKVWPGLDGIPKRGWRNWRSSERFSLASPSTHKKPPVLVRYTIVLLCLVPVVSRSQTPVAASACTTLTAAADSARMYLALQVRPSPRGPQLPEGYLQMLGVDVAARVRVPSQLDLLTYVPLVLRVKRQNAKQWDFGNSAAYEVILRRTGSHAGPRTTRTSLSENLDRAIHSGVASSMNESGLWAFPEDARGRDVTLQLTLEITDSLRLGFVPLAALRTPPLEPERLPKVIPLPHGPLYPPDMRSRHIEGEVISRFVVDGHGRIVPVTIEIVRSTTQQFEESVRKYLRTMRFVPGSVGGCIVPMLIEMPFQFALG